MRDVIRTAVSLVTFTSACLLAVLSSAEYAVTDIVDAARRGDGHAVHKLIELDSGAVTVRDAHGNTALHWAALRGHWRLVAELVASRAPVNAVGSGGRTPLHNACHHDRTDVVEMLLDAGADPNLRDQSGNTPLHVAARRGCVNVAELLIRRVANPNPRNNEGSTPLHVALGSGHDSLARMLLSIGADGELRNDRGLRPAETARARPSELDIDPAVLDDYVGIYDLEDGQTVKVWRDGDQLAIRSAAPDLMYPIGTDAFFCRQEPCRVTFRRSGTGVVDGVELESMGHVARSAKARTTRYVGSRVCRECHSDGPNGGAWVTWLRSRHAHAYWRLASDWSLYLARLRPHYADLEDPITDSRCLLCHVSAQQDEDALTDAGFRIEEGVGCEACHGPGSSYADPDIMADRDRFQANGGIVPDATTCRRCHRNSERFAFDTWWPEIAHGDAEGPSRTDSRRRN